MRFKGQGARGTHVFIRNGNRRGAKGGGQGRGGGGGGVIQGSLVVSRKYDGGGRFAGLRERKERGRGVMVLSYCYRDSESNSASGEEE